MYKIAISKCDWTDDCTFEGESVVYIVLTDGLMNESISIPSSASAKLYGCSFIISYTHKQQYSWQKKGIPRV